MFVVGGGGGGGGGVGVVFFFFFFKQKTAYEIGTGDWSSDVCSSDLAIVSAHSTKGFHYSPLKLREYLITGLATLAPRAGEVPEKFKDNEHVILYDIGDVKGLADRKSVV